MMVRLPGGTFLMGNPEDEAESRNDEHPQHQVTLSPFLIAKYEVSQAEWKKVMGTSSSKAKGQDLPVERVSWEDCQSFYQKTGLSLPTEAQWEYACRAGTSTPYGGTGKLDEMGWYGENSGGKTHPVGEKEPNAFGLHDMHGNVWEWCEDVFDTGFYSKRKAKRKNPVCTSGSVYRVLRGGGWVYGARYCRSACRVRRAPSFRLVDVGFRPSRSSP